MSSNSDVVIVAAHRTPIGAFNGSLSTLKAHELGSIVIKHILSTHNNCLPNEVFIGQALTAGQGQNPARQASVNAGLPYTIPATTINMLCGSGLKAVVLGYQSIRAGDANVVICGGQESMSQCPHCLHIRKGQTMGDAKMIDTMMYDGLTDAFNNVPMGITAETVAKTCNVPREDQDQFAYESQMKCKRSNEQNVFQNEIVSVTIKTKQSEKILSIDESVRCETTVEGLNKLNPCFKSKSDGGTVTAGNACGVNDGAAMLLLMNSSEAEQRQFEPLVRIVSWAQCGNDPLLMGICPIEAIQDCVKKAHWTLEDVDLFEINEAFAAQSIPIVKTLNLDKNKVNINGGSIGLGHPIGCSGARILVTLIHSLIRNNLKRGVAGICIGGGMAIAMCVERV